MNPQLSTTVIEALIIAATLLFVLLVVGIALSLAAAETRSERNTLIALGASPSSLRRRSAATAIVLAATGGALAVPSGLLPTIAITTTHPGPTNVGLPWLSIIALVAIIPLLAGSAPDTGTALVQRFRPPRPITTFTD